MVSARLDKDANQKRANLFSHRVREKASAESAQKKREKKNATRTINQKKKTNTQNARARTFCRSIFSVVFTCRNLWVFNHRNKLNRFENGVHVINQYADYDEMMIKFWIWDVEKFKLPKFCK